MNKEFKKEDIRIALFLHQNLTIHICILTLINFVNFILMFLAFEYLKMPVMNYEIIGFIFYVILFTIIETIFKILATRFFYNIVAASFGLIFYLTQIANFYISKVFFDKIVIRINFFENLFFIAIFLVLRFLIIFLYRRKIIYKKEI